MKKNLKLAFFAIILGILLGKYIFNQYSEEAVSTINNKKDIYLVQYGVYKNEDNMKESAKNLKNYFYFKDDKGYHVIVAITSKKELKDKILSAYNMSDNVYLKKVSIDNEEFTKLLDQYDSLIEQTQDFDIVLSAEKQILSRYEEIITYNE